MILALDSVSVEAERFSSLRNAAGQDLRTRRRHHVKQHGRPIGGIIETVEVTAAGLSVGFRVGFEAFADETHGFTFIGAYDSLDEAVAAVALFAS